jgi:hypothetical protein
MIYIVYKNTLFSTSEFMMATILKLTQESEYSHLSFLSLMARLSIHNFFLFLTPQGLAVIFSHHQVCIKKKGGHFLGGLK